jgi:phage terminase Nu1 subunit (DNA packaging protein)
MARAAAKLGPEWPIEVDGFQLAEMILVSVRHIRDLKKKGIVFAGSRPGLYRFPESLHGYLDYKRRLAAETGALSPLTIEKAKSVSVRRKIAELDLADRLSEILTLEEADASWKMFATGIKRALLSLPDEFKKAIPSATAHDKLLFRTQVLDILDDLAREAEDSVIGADPDLLRPTDDERAGVKPRRKRK